MITVHGKAGERVTVLADSINTQDDRLLTYELEYPRIIHAELLTHGMLSRNSASSRAIPFAKMKEQLKGRPVHFGANQSGMQDKGEHDGLIEGKPEEGDDRGYLYTPEEAWGLAKDDALFWSEAFANAGYHKQVFNRLTEPFQMMKVVLSGTEFANFFWLRNHEAADPSLHELARCMFEARGLSKPVLLQPGEWHLPYVYCTSHGYYMDESREEKLNVEDAIKVSAVRCAAVSYRNEGYGLEKCLETYDKLVGGDRKHASAFEHQGTPMEDWVYDPMERKIKVNSPYHPSMWQDGITHVDRKGRLWSAKFCGWIQYRKLIPGENYTGEEE